MAPTGSTCLRIHSSAAITSNTANYGHQGELEIIDGRYPLGWASVSGAAGTSMLVQEWFSSARVVKSLNHLGYFKFEKSRLPEGTQGRIAIAAAGDDRGAVAAVLELIDALGFDAVDAGNLESGLALQPGGPVFGAGHGAKELSILLSHEAASALLPSN